VIQPPGAGFVFQKVVEEQSQGPRLQKIGNTLADCGGYPNARAWSAAEKLDDSVLRRDFQP